MSAAALSARSSGAAMTGRSSRHPDDYAYWEREALPSHGGLEPEPSGGSLPRTVSREFSRTSARPDSALSNHSVSNGGDARSRRSTETKPHPVGIVEPWEAEPDPEPQQPRSRAESVVNAASAGGAESPKGVLSRENSKSSPSPRPGSGTAAPSSHRRSQLGLGGGGNVPVANEYEDGPGARRSQRPSREQGAPAEEYWPQERRQSEGEEAEPAGAHPNTYERGSRAASIAGASEPEANGGVGSPRAGTPKVSRDGSSAPFARPAPPSVHSHRSFGGGGSRRPSGGPVEMRDLPPEALPWSEPPEYVSRPPSTVSITGPGSAAAPGALPALTQERSQGSVRAPSVAPSNRSVPSQKPSGNRPVEVPMLPLRDLAAGSRPMSIAAGYEPAPPPPPAPPSPSPPPPAPAPPPAIVAVASEEVLQPLSREGSRTALVRPPSAMSMPASGRSGPRAPSHRSHIEVPSYPLTDLDYGSPAGTPTGGTPTGGGAPMEPQPGYDSPRLGSGLGRDGGSKPSMRPSSATSSNGNLDRKTPFATKSAVEWHSSAVVEQLPWSARALADFKAQMKRATFVMADPAEDPLAARMDAVFALPPELWPVLPPGALYCLEAFDPRVNFGYLQHCDFPDTKVRVNTYFGKYGRHLVDYVVSWQPIPRAEAAWQPVDGKQPPLPWEPRQVVAHTTNGEYQYANTRMRFKGPSSTKPDAEVVEWSDAHGVDLLDTKAANETAPRNSDKDREARLIDPPRPNTWGEMARRPLIGSLRARGGGAYVHHVNYDHSGLRTTCGRRVPAGYFFSLIPNAAAKTPAVPGNSLRSSSVGRSPGGGLRASGEPSGLRVRSVNSPVQALLGTIGDSVASSKWGAVMGTSSSAVLIGGNSRPSSAGPRRKTAGTATGITASNNGSPPESGRLPQLGATISSVGPTDLAALRSSMGGGVQREGSRLVAPTSPTLVAMAPRNRWRTYDVPFNHPIHSARAQELGTDMAMATGRGGVRTFSDAAAVLHVAEQELRLSRAFVPGPVVIGNWDDIPRLYAEHMEAARALMPVTELDNYGSSKLHMLVHHLQAAATLEYDRLDAKLLLLPQMARLGKKSAEIDSWLQVIVEHAAYLYDKLEITDRARWRPPLHAHPPEQQRPPMRRSVTFAKAAALANPNQLPSWAFPDPLVGTSFAGRSALNVAVQAPTPPPVNALPVHCISVDEWAAITKIMDTCRHTILYDHWARLRPVMTGSAQPGSYSASRAGSMVAASSDACATASGEGDRLPEDPLYSHGNVNRELLDYMHQDLAAMSSPDFVPQPPPPAKLPKHRGYRGEGPLPPELVADMPTVHKPVRCRGADETPLPPEFQKMDLWNVRNKAEQVNMERGNDGHHRLDAGALRFSQVSVSRLLAAKGFADTRQAEIRRGMQRAKGTNVFDDADVPEYGSDIAEDDVASVATDFTVHTDTGRPRRRRHPNGPIPKVPGVVPGIACQTTEDDLPGPEYFQELEESKSRMLAEAQESRRLLLMGNGGKSREQVLVDALKSAEGAIHLLKPRPIGASPSPLLEPDSPTSYLNQQEKDAYGELMGPAWKPYGHGQEPYSRQAGFAASVRPPGGAAPVDPFKRGGGQQADASAALRSRAGNVETFGKGPEPFSLEKIIAERSFEDHEPVTTDVPKTNPSGFGGVSIGIGGLVDYETAMARRRAIAGAEIAVSRSNYVPKNEVLNLFVTYCNLGGHPELIEMLQKAVDAPVSTVTVSAVAKAVSATSRNATSGRPDVESEETRQRIRGTAWLLGVTWRRISNETYTSFLSRVLGWPGEVAASLHRTRATQLIARSLVRGHDVATVPKAPPRF